MVKKGMNGKNTDMVRVIFNEHHSSLGCDVHTTCHLRISDRNGLERARSHINTLEGRGLLEELKKYCVLHDPADNDTGKRRPAMLSFREADGYDRFALPVRIAHYQDGQLDDPDPFIPALRRFGTFETIMEHHRAGKYLTGMTIKSDALFQETRLMLLRWRAVRKHGAGFFRALRDTFLDVSTGESAAQPSDTAPLASAMGITGPNRPQDGARAQSAATEPRP